MSFIDREKPEAKIVARSTEEIWAWIEQDTLRGSVDQVRAEFDQWLAQVKREAVLEAVQEIKAIVNDAMVAHPAHALPDKPGVRFKALRRTENISTTPLTFVTLADGRPVSCSPGAHPWDRDSFESEWTVTEVIDK